VQQNATTHNKAQQGTTNYGTQQQHITKHDKTQETTTNYSKAK